MNTLKNNDEVFFNEIEKLVEFKEIKSKYDTQKRILNNFAYTQNDGSGMFWIYNLEIKNKILEIRNHVANNQDFMIASPELQNHILVLLDRHLSFEENAFKAFLYLEGGKKTEFIEVLSNANRILDDIYHEINAIDYSVKDVVDYSNTTNQSTIDSHLTLLILLISLIGVVCFVLSFLLNRINKNLQTDIKMKTQNINELNENLLDLDKKRSEFISIASHELKGPIQPIMGFIELAKNQIISENEALEGISNITTHLENVANNVLDLSKIENSKLELNLEPIMINTVIEEVMKTEFYNPNRKAPILFNGDLNIDVHLDRTRIKQVIRNILDNCIKYTSSGEIKIRNQKIIWSAH
jgi:signal transduction histidine kinase